MYCHYETQLYHPLKNTVLTKTLCLPGTYNNSDFRYKQIEELLLLVFYTVSSRHSCFKHGESKSNFAKLRY